jgi:hypothetical protein
MFRGLIASLRNSAATPQRATNSLGSLLAMLSIDELLIAQLVRCAGEVEGTSVAAGAGNVRHCSADYPHRRPFELKYSCGTPDSPLASSLHFPNGGGASEHAPLSVVDDQAGSRNAMEAAVGNLIKEAGYVRHQPPIIVPYHGAAIA